MVVRTVSGSERRARLATRHALAPGHRVASVEAAVAAMTCLHATEPASVYLSAHARSAVTREDALTAGGSVLRGEPAAGWKVSRPFGRTAEDRLGSEPERLGEREGYVRRALRPARRRDRPLALPVAARARPRVGGGG